MLLRDSDARLPPLLFYGYIGVSVLLILLAGLMSGLTLALMSLDELDIEVRLRARAPVCVRACLGGCGCVAAKPAVAACEAPDAWLACR
jgi:hypothetical protein